MANNYNIAYCSNASCPFVDCKHHLSNVITSSSNLSIRYVNIADYSGVCRRYIGYLVDYIKKGN